MQEALKALTETGHIECEKKGGPGGYRYTVPRDPEETGLGIHLSAPDDDGGGGDGAGHPGTDGEEPAQSRNKGEESQEGDVARGSARNGARAIEGPLSQEESSIARAREEVQGERFENDQPEEGEVDHIGELTHLGWYRAQTAFSTEATDDYPLGRDPVARWLRYEVGIFKGRGWWSDVYGNPTPLVISAGRLFEIGPESSVEDGQHSESWPGTPEEMAERLEKVIALLQDGEHRFWDPGYSDWCARAMIDHPRDLEKACKPAYLHAELWRNEKTGEEVWALVALKDGRRVPDEAIEEAVWSWATADLDTPDEVVIDDPDGEFRF